MPKEEFDRRKEKFRSKDLTAEERAWIHQRLEHGYEPSLMQRLRELVITHAFPYFDSRVKDRELFCRQAKDNRNYYTHFNSRLKKKALEGKELFDLKESLKLILLSALFRSIGIPIEAIERSIQGLIY